MPVFCAYVGRWRGAIQTSLIFILFPLHFVPHPVPTSPFEQRKYIPLPLRTLEAKLPMLSKKSTYVEDFD